MFNFYPIDSVYKLHYCDVDYDTLIPNAKIAIGKYVFDGINIWTINDGIVKKLEYRNVSSIRFRNFNVEVVTDNTNIQYITSHRINISYIRNRMCGEIIYNIVRSRSVPHEYYVDTVCVNGKLNRHYIANCHYVQDLTENSLVAYEDFPNYATISVRGDMDEDYIFLKSNQRLYKLPYRHHSIVNVNGALSCNDGGISVTEYDTHFVVHLYYTNACFLKNGYYDQCITSSSMDFSLVRFKRD